MSEIGLIGKKIGMSREFYKTGQSVPVTVIKLEKGRIIQVIGKEKRGYNAVQIGFGKIYIVRREVFYFFTHISGIAFDTLTRI